MQTTILIVDDEEGLVDLLEEALAAHWPAAEVDRAHSGEEGLSRLAKHPYDLVITDYRMPGFNGLEFLHGVRYLDPATSIILMSAYGSEDMRREARELGVDLFLNKPFELDDLLLAARSLLVDRKRGSDV